MDSITNNEFYHAVEKSINQFGRAIVNENRFVNILSDYGAFCSFPAYRYILEHIITENLTSLITEIDTAEDAISVEYRIIQRLTNKYGLQESIVSCVVKTLIHAVYPYYFNVNDSMENSELTPIFACKEEEKENKELDITSNITLINHKEPFINYVFPNTDLLKTYKNEDELDQEPVELIENQIRIEDLLKGFKINIKNINCTETPVITFYEIELAPGTRITKVRNYSQDIELALGGARLVAPIPGKMTIGIEVPKRDKKIVSMRSVLSSNEYNDNNLALPLYLGKTIDNNVYLADLSEFPHLLIGGGSEKEISVCLNSIITSLLYKKHPNELKFIIMDLLRNDFCLYRNIQNHFMAQIEDTDDAVITDPMIALRTLESLYHLAEIRVDLLNIANCRNIAEYNSKFIHHKLRLVDGHDYMPYIVLVIDECCDLFCYESNYINGIAKLGRFVGIHLVLATRRIEQKIFNQDVIKHITSRIAFRTSKNKDSVFLIGEEEACKLSGDGDMLLFDNRLGLVRLQSPNVDDEEIENIANFICSQPGPVEPLELPEGRYESVDITNLDPLFDQAAQSVVSSGQGSTSMIQRQFSIGYNRTGRLMDQLEMCGIVGPAKGSKPREVLVQDVVALDVLLQELHNKI